MNGMVRQVVVVIAFLAMVVMNALANALPLAGRATGEISDRFPIPFTPAGWVFSIWGLIYLALAVFVIVQARPSRRDDAELDRVGPWFVVSCAFNIAWLVAWHNLAISWTLPLMLGLLGSLVAIYLILRAPAAVAQARKADVRSRGERRRAVQAPFSLYLGWITVATVANVAIFLYDLGWQPGRGSAELWSFALVAVACLIGITMVLRRRDLVYGAVLVWAFAGIAAKEWDAMLLAAGAVTAAGALALLMLRAWVRRRGGSGAGAGA